MSLNKLFHYSYSERVCYRTTVDWCENKYRIYLKLRNNDQCSEDQITSGGENDTEKIFTSPLHGSGSGCRNKYRKSDMCLYSISIPNCASGKVRLESINHEIQQPRDGSCRDYIQFFYGNSSSDKFCGNDLVGSQWPLDIPATEFMAVFWTDPVINEGGFQIRAKCG